MSNLPAPCILRIGRQGAVAVHTNRPFFGNLKTSVFKRRPAVPSVVVLMLAEPAQETNCVIQSVLGGR
jgi:hypothetical protein